MKYVRKATPLLLPLMLFLEIVFFFTNGYGLLNLIEQKFDMGIVLQILWIISPVLTMLLLNAFYAGKDYKKKAKNTVISQILLIFLLGIYWEIQGKDPMLEMLLIFFDVWEIISAALILVYYLIAHLVCKRKKRLKADGHQDEGKELTDEKL